MNSLLLITIVVQVVLLVVDHPVPVVLAVIIMEHHVVHFPVMRLVSVVCNIRTWEQLVVLKES